ncbi:hypothetical protein BV22DRAFT_1051999 [Leucogyrophana mollusca]|uniref:Uncharacterized protein n=1 Tax=Leucogyrophana mollusca TaxID=85980 RepID=A0ACB8AYX7_9AGAM|nr:hypothetical protein BV22DRAFT_1051999 [Leucogyrophana mollusca]
MTLLPCTGSSLELLKQQLSLLDSQLFLGMRVDGIKIGSTNKSYIRACSGWLEVKCPPTSGIYSCCDSVKYAILEFQVTGTVTVCTKSLTCPFETGCILLVLTRNALWYKQSSQPGVMCFMVTLDVLFRPWFWGEAFLKALLNWSGRLVVKVMLWKWGLSGGGMRGKFRVMGVERAGRPACFIIAIERKMGEVEK